MSRILTTRRALIGAAGIAGAGLLLSGCDASSPLLDHTDMLNLRAHRLVGARGALAREFRLDQRSPSFRTNGTRRPDSAAYRRHEATGFADWRLRIDGLVDRPLELSLADLMGMSSRTQVTRHDCVEGWSAIGQWTGTPLGYLLRQAGVRENARFAAMHCADDFSGTPYYESIDLIDAFHPQTIMAWGLNGARLPVGNGAPLRLRVERQLGYKHAKYVTRVELRDSLAGLGGGKGGYWEDVADYEWYAGI